MHNTKVFKTRQTTGEKNIINNLYNVNGCVIIVRLHENVIIDTRGATREELSSPLSFDLVGTFG